MALPRWQVGVQLPPPPRAFCLVPALDVYTGHRRAFSLTTKSQPPGLSTPLSSRFHVAESDQVALSFTSARRKKRGEKQADFVFDERLAVTPEMQR